MVRSVERPLRTVAESLRVELERSIDLVIKQESTCAAKAPCLRALTSGLKSLSRAISFWAVQSEDDGNQKITPDEETSARSQAISMWDNFKFRVIPKLAQGIQEDQNPILDLVSKIDGGLSPETILEWVNKGASPIDISSGFYLSP